MGKATQVNIKQLVLLAVGQAFKGTDVFPGQLIFLNERKIKYNKFKHAVMAKRMYSP